MRAIRFVLFLVFLTPGFILADEVSIRKSVEGNPKQEYFLIDHSKGAKPKDGYKLLLVLPGGNGSADFNPFVTNMGKHAVGEDYLVAQLIAVTWTPDQRGTPPIKWTRISWSIWV